MGTSLNFTNGGKEVSTSEILAPEDFGDCVGLYKTLRALFNTISYVSISTPAFFPWHVGEDLADLLSDWMHTKYGGNAIAQGKRHPLPFFIQAFTTMWSHFMDQVCNGNNGQGMTLAELVANEPWYRPMWTQYIPMTGNGSNRGGGGGGGGSVSHPDNSHELSRQIHSVIQTNKRLQHNVDRLQPDNRRQMAPVMHPPSMAPGTQRMDGHRGGNGGGGFGGGGNGSGRRGGGDGARNDRDAIKGTAMTLAVVVAAKGVAMVVTVATTAVGRRDEDGLVMRQCGRHCSVHHHKWMDRSGVGI